MPDYVLPTDYPDMPKLPRAFDAPPEQIHPGQLDGEHPAIEQAREALAYARDEAIAINTLRFTPGDEDHASAHDRRVRERCDEYEHRLIELIDDANAALTKVLDEADAELANKAGLISDPAWRETVAAMFRDMSGYGERTKAIGELLDQDDHASLASLIEAPLFVSKLNSELRDRIREMVYEKVSPDTLALRNQILKAISKVDTASLTLLTLIAKLRVGTEIGAWRERSRAAAIRNLGVM